jgi:hypothetical protein
MMQQRLYANYEQSASVRALLDGAGLHPNRNGFVLIPEARHLYGLDGGTFVFVRNHPKPVPAEIMAKVEQLGFCVIELSDEFARAKARARRCA